MAYKVKFKTENVCNVQLHGWVRKEDLIQFAEIAKIKKVNKCKLLRMMINDEYQRIKNYKNEK